MFKKIIRSRGLLFGAWGAYLLLVLSLFAFVRLAAPSLNSKIGVRMLLPPATPIEHAQALKGRQPDTEESDVKPKLTKKHLKFYPKHVKLALMESLPTGVIPQAGPNGELPWKVYAQKIPDATDDLPRISIVMVGLGRHQKATSEAIHKLPRSVTLGFSPHASELNRWIQLAYQKGHDSLMMLTLEPITYPRNDPGPDTLLTGLPANENITRLHKTLSQGAGYIGLVNSMGSRFLSSPKDLTLILAEVQQRGLLFLEMKPSFRSKAAGIANDLNLAYLGGDVQLDGIVSAPSIQKKLALAETVAAQKGRAVVTCYAYPLTISEIRKWTPTLEAKKIRLAPLSEIMHAQLKEEPPEKEKEKKPHVHPEKH